MHQPIPCTFKNSIKPAANACPLKKNTLPEIHSSSIYLSKEITGADGSIDILDTAGRNVDTAYDAATVGALSDSAM